MQRGIWLKITGYWQIRSFQGYKQSVELSEFTLILATRVCRQSFDEANICTVFSAFGHLLQHSNVAVERKQCCHEFINSVSSTHWHYKEAWNNGLLEYTISGNTAKTLKSANRYFSVSCKAYLLCMCEPPTEHFYTDCQLSGQRPPSQSARSMAVPTPIGLGSAETRWIYFLPHWN